jgi:ribose transport system ATP-binding protein
MHILLWTQKKYPILCRRPTGAKQARARETFMGEANPSAITPSIIGMRGIVKTFGGTRAVDHVDFDIREGEVHALLGGNGAGKSTLIKVLAGVHRPDAGRILLADRTVDPQAETLPVAFIHQDLALVEWMSVAENIALAAGYPRRGGVIGWNAVTEQARSALDIIGCALDPHGRIADLSRTDRSIVAIARALATDARAIVLDEPTASLPEAEVAKLFGVLGRLRQRGRGMVYVSHRLDEIFRIADRVTVMRDGKAVATRAIAETSPAELVELIVGRRPRAIAARAPVKPCAPLLEIIGLATDTAGPVDLSIRPGEIVGLAGLRGAGQEAIGRALSGVLPAISGEVRLDTKRLRLDTPADGVRAGVAFVSSRRQEESLALNLAVRENLFINPVVEGRNTLDALAPARESEQALSRLRHVDARPLVSEPAIHTFSGGNQQKVVMARWLGGAMRVLVLEEPTMGVDVGAKADIYALLDRHAASGGCVVVVSTDLEEVAAICHRVMIFGGGRITAELAEGTLTLAGLIAHVGGSGASAAA